ncbi:hypothetical protein B0H17DRAFT_1135997 [Mycena rosella]|uniref:Uncharacterized protein n=1 Tax=Mycena rosella TaxID=1033263 RepID=A0AAD7DBK7_MYCRO|nr:hypothetical protein B0H17DRAFT_1135997 [Mycena rosella]
MAAPPVVPSRPSFRRPSARRTVPLPSRQEKSLGSNGTGRLPVTGTRQTVATGTAHSPREETVAFENGTPSPLGPDAAVLRCRTLVLNGGDLAYLGKYVVYQNRLDPPAVGRVE